MPPASHPACRSPRSVLPLAWLLLQGCAGLGAGPRPTDAQRAVQLAAQARRWDEAIVQKDRAAIEANMAEDFRQIDGAGNVETKRSFVDDLMAPELEIDPFRVEDFEVRLYGEVALLSGSTRMSGRYGGKPFRSHYRYIDVYVLRGAEWKIVSVQISRMPDSPPD